MKKRNTTHSVTHKAPLKIQILTHIQIHNANTQTLSVITLVEQHNYQFPLRALGNLFLIGSQLGIYMD